MRLNYVNEYDHVNESLFSMRRAFLMTHNSYFSEHELLFRRHCEHASPTSGARLNRTNMKRATCHVPSQSSSDGVLVNGRIYCHFPFYVTPIFLAYRSLQKTLNVLKYIGGFHFTNK